MYDSKQANKKDTQEKLDDQKVILHLFPSKGWQKIVFKSQGKECNKKLKVKEIRKVWRCAATTERGKGESELYEYVFWISLNASLVLFGGVFSSSVMLASFYFFLSYGRCLLSYLVTSFFFSWQFLLALQMGGSLGDPWLHLLCTGCHFPCHGDTSWGWMSPIHQVTKANGEFGEKWLFENDVTKTVMEASNCLDYILLNELGSLLA